MQLGSNIIKRLGIHVATALAATLILVSPALAGTTNHRDPHPAAFRLPLQGPSLIDPATDPLPGWLILPDTIGSPRVNPGPARGTILIQASDSTGHWDITARRDGKAITYVHIGGGEPGFIARTNADYHGVTLYNLRGKIIQTLSPDEFFSPDAIHYKTGCRTDGMACRPQAIDHVRHNTQLLKQQVRSLAWHAGFRGDNLRVAVAVAQAESNRHVGAVLCNTKPAFNPAHHFSSGVQQCHQARVTADRGLWQINDYYHKGYSDACTFSPRCAAKASYNISSKGRNFTPWTTYANNAYRSYLD